MSRGCPSPSLPPADLRLQSPLHWRAFDDEWVVRAQASGSLFHLAPLPAALLGLIEGGLGQVAALSAAVAEATGQADDAVLHQAVAQALEQLVAADLVCADQT